MKNESPKTLPQDILKSRIDEIVKALDTAGLVADELTLTALSNILVSFCVESGVKKKQFKQIMDDTWRSFSINKMNRDSMRAKLDALPEEDKVKLLEEVMKEKMPLEVPKDLPGPL